MNTVIEVIGLGILVPAVVALAVFALACRLLGAATAPRYAAAVAFAAGSCLGYVLLPSWAELVPTRHWHWTLYLAPAAAVVGAIAAADGLVLAERLLLWGLTAIVASWLLVPGWASLEPSRSTWVPLLAGYMTVLTALAEPLSRRFSATMWLSTLAAASAAVALVLAGLVSLTYAQPAGTAAAALVGCALAARVGPAPAHVRGLGLAYAVIVGGWAFIGCVEPRQPLVALLLVPAAPLALWGCCHGKLVSLLRRPGPQWS